ncbi:hypothetical protein [Spirochaeta africana]|uniref:Uncharacterized protein n=1 Tax=Spirochaeta africana (strain ATCC 700263 / DSM 8902 / Z-7692) TaxID=889378 RepID=H9UIT1_SPIAZ|nr:hypothetical protein [Spirochaeta africana]AFG37424.1 hypothetical protein Spiaf_1358 [Spirochaeta africana DSM 8902]
MSDDVLPDDRLNVVRVTQNFIYGLRDTLEENHPAYELCSKVLADLIELKISLLDDGMADE